MNGAPGVTPGACGRTEKPCILAWGSLRMASASKVLAQSSDAAVGLSGSATSAAMAAAYGTDAAMAAMASSRCASRT